LTLADRYVAERARVDHLRESISRALSGRETNFLLDYEPSSRYCVGVLTPPPPQADDESRAMRRARRKPDALGFSARVEPASGIVSGVFALRFALYYRELPTYEEQRGVADTSDASGTERFRQKFRRVDVAINDLPFSASIPSRGTIAEIEFSEANAQIADHVRSVATDIAAAPLCWPGDNEHRLNRAALASEFTYGSAIPKGAATLPEWHILLNGRLMHTGDGWRLSVLAQNRTVGDTPHPIEVFDMQLSASLNDGIFTPEPFVAAVLDYRYETLSWGRGVNAVLEVGDNQKTVRTETLPVYHQPRTRSKGASNECETEVLAGDGVLDSLRRIAGQLDKYAVEWEEKNEHYAGDPTGAARAADLEKFRREIRQFRFGIAALNRDPRLLRAFQLANQAAAERGLRSWRLFQVVFIVGIAPSLLARELPDDAELRSDLETVDVLWFPTGGGKTEAYFGVILTAMFYDRLRGKARGTTAWLRYPLRMLSIQQLQRLIDFVVAAESVRIKALKQDGGDPFTLGYYVGSANTPNELTWIRPPHPIHRYVQEAAANSGDAASLHVLQWCPFCKTDSPRVEIDESPSVLRLLHRCRNGDCRRIAPIFLSDSEIYRYAPTVIVGTVDRLARAGQTGLFSHILGQFDAICPQHGYASFRTCVEAACTCKPSTFAPVNTVYDPTPALLLQDELHLLKESLGTYDAHFEGFLDVAAARTGTGLPSKRLAATATIEGYEKHVYELYGREARRFPAKGREELDSAYVSLNEESPVARLYLGILPFGIDSDEIAARIAEIAATEAERYWVNANHDPELAGRYDLALIYANQKNTVGNVGARLRSQLEVLGLTGDRSLDEVRAAIDRIESDKAKPYPERLQTLIATSLISHGVDLSRLNVMAFVGFPGRAADYIQSSSRVGRENVGLVCTVFDPNDNLNRSTYLHFHEYHERLYQLVQPVPISRFSEASVARTFTGIYSALLLNVVAPLLRGAGLINAPFDRGRQFLQALERGIVTDDELIDLIAEAYGMDRYGLPTEVAGMLWSLISRKARLARQNVETGEDYMTHKRLKPPPVSSLRDIEDQIEFRIGYRFREELDRVRGY
jgi:hypothetical protein